MALTLTYDSVLSRIRISGNLPVVDTFTRSVSNEWGTSTSGHVWSTSGGASSDYSVNGTLGLHSLGSVNIARESRLAVGFADGEFVIDGIGVPAAPTGAGLTHAIRARYVDGGNFVDARLFRGITGSVGINVRQVLAGVETFSAFPTVPGVTSTSAISVRFGWIGSTLRARAWPTGGAEPATWQVELVATFLSAGDVAIRSSLDAGNTNSLPVVVDNDNLAVTTPSVAIERSTNQVNWTTVRGGTVLVPVSGAISLDDYEFAPDVTNYYRAAGQSANITPVLDGVWLKSLARPFLNRTVTPRGFSPLRRPSRGGVFEVVGRSDPTAVTDVRGSKRFTLDINTYSDTEAEELDLLLATGDILLVHVPTTGRLRVVPGGYVTVGDSEELVLPTLDLVHRVFSVGLTRCAAPGPDIVGATITCAGILNLYASCSALLAAHPTCADVLSLVGSPGDVLVP